LESLKALIVFSLRAPEKTRKRGDYRRAVEVAPVPLVFCALRFASRFLALMRCLRHATRFVLFMLASPLSF
jgi:hypothetical protein